MREPSKLKRQLNAFDCVMLVAGGVVGVGIFINPSEVASTIRSPSAILLAWVLGGIAAAIGGISYSKLGRWLPEAGGQYTFLREAYHPGVAFLYGWTLLLAIFSGVAAAVSLTFARYLVVLVPALAGLERLIGVALIAALAAVNYRGVRLSGNVQNVLTVTKLTSIAFLVFLALRSTRAAQLSTEPAAPAPDLSTFLFGLIPVLFSYGGWYNLTFMAGEVRRPERSIPIGLIGGIALVIATYALINAAYVRTLTVDEIAASPAVAADMARRVMGPIGSSVVAVFILISAPAVVNIITMAGSRVYYAMARDGVFFQKAAFLHPRFGTPVYSILAQALWSSVLLITQSYRQLLQHTMFPEWLFFALTGLSVFVFSRRHRDFYSSTRERVLISACAALFAFIAGCIVLNAIYYSPVQSAIGLGIIACGVPAYYFLRRKHSVSTSET